MAAGGAAATHAAGCASGARASELEQGDLGSLQQTATQIINLEPKSPEGYLLRAQGNIKSKHFSQAGDDVDKAIEIAPDSAEGYVVSGNLQLAQEKYSEAGKLFEQALARDASSASAIEGLVKAYSGEHDYEKAMAAVQAQIVKAPNSSPLYDALGTAYFMGKTDLKSAENALRKAVALDDNNSNALIKLGQAQTAQGNTDGAISTYKNALRNAPAMWTLISCLESCTSRRRIGVTQRATIRRLCRAA